MPDQPTRRRSLLKAAAAGTAAVAGLATASRSGLLGNGGSGGSGGLPTLLLSGDDGSGVKVLEAPLGDELLPRVGTRRWRSAHLPTSTHSMVGFVWGRDQPEPSLRISSRRDGEWSAWQQVPLMHDLPDEGDEEWAARAGTQLVWVGDTDGIRIRADGHRPDDITLVLLHPAKRAGDALAGSAPGTLARSDGALLPARPAMLGRVQWGADESWRNGTPRYNTTIEQVHVHHTANSNDYAEDDVPAILRGIYRYHTSSLGWSDIAYNFLVDRFGRTWIGRAGGAAKPVRGAHTLGFNGTSTGIAVIGNYEGVAPGLETLAAIVRVAAWKLAPYQRDPVGTIAVVSEGSDKYGSAQVAVLPVIDGHRDTNDTACPGQLLYDRLPDIRRQTKDRMATVPAVAITQPFALTGDNLVGATLSVTPGTFTPPEALVTYTWLRDGVATGEPSASTHVLAPEDFARQLSVQVDVAAPGYTSASQLVSLPALVQTQAVVALRLRARRGNIRANVTVSAPGLAAPVTGAVRVRADRRTPRLVDIVAGAGVARLRDFGKGEHTVKVTYRGSALVRGAKVRKTVRIRNG